MSLYIVNIDPGSISHPDLVARDISDVISDNTRLSVVEVVEMPLIDGKDQVIIGLNELVRELTAHADAMRGLLEEAALNALSSDMWADEKNGNKYMKAITAYDEFVREC